MNGERIEEIFYELMDYLCGVDEKTCVNVLKKVGVTKEEAIKLEFFDSITEQL